MTLPESDPRKMPSSALTTLRPPAGMTSVESGSTRQGAAAFAEFNAELNSAYGMGDFRARGGIVVRSIEERRRRLIASRVRRSRPRVVVDVGCEDGWIAESYAASVGETLLVDLDPAMLARAEAKGLPRTRCAVGDATDPSVLPPKTADVLVLSAVLEHLPDPGAALSSLVRAVRPGGSVVAFVPADGPILTIKAILRATGLSVFVRGVSLEPAPGHLHCFNRASFTRLMRRAGVVEELRFDPLVLGYVAVARVAS